MTPKEQRISLAEWAGWKRHVVPLHDADGLVTELKTMIRWTSPGDTLQDNPYWNIREIPDYLNDLNAVHELEKKLTPLQWNDYANKLIQYWEAGGTRFAGAIHATAAQRCEALLKTLNLWKP